MGLEIPRLRGFLRGLPGPAFTRPLGIVGYLPP